MNGVNARVVVRILSFEKHETIAVVIHILYPQILLHYVVRVHLLPQYHLKISKKYVLHIKQLLRYRAPFSSQRNIRQLLLSPIFFISSPFRDLYIIDWRSRPLRAFW